MKQALNLQLRLGQQLTMTPQLQQAIRLLQLSTLELRMEVQQTIDSNLMLEVDEELEQESDTAELEASQLEANQIEERFEATDGQSSEMDLDRQQEIPDDLAVDSNWDDHFTNTSLTAGSQPADNDRVFENPDNSGHALHDHLIWQLQMSQLNETDAAIATTIVDAIGDSGYLEDTLEEIQQSLAGDYEVDLAEIEAVLHRVQQLDPPGISARDPAECLLIQLGQLDPTTPWLEAAKWLVGENLDLLAKQNLPKLSREMGLNEALLAEVIMLVRSLNPHPGDLVPSSEPEYIIPDVVVTKRDSIWRVDLNQEVAPRLRINPLYAGMVQRGNNDPDNTTMRSHLQEARWFLRSLQSRHETLLKVARTIVDRQCDFLEHGDEAMRPMILRDVAEEIDMHESTISRVTTQKYMHTPRGIFEFKYFFSSHVSTTDGGTASAVAIRALIRKLIDAEDGRKPLSDNRISALLDKQGIQVARRTVAKYRESMTIPPSSERKRLM